MENENKKIQQAKDIEVKIENINVELDKQNPEMVARIRLITDKGDITCKPKVGKTKNYKGLKTFYEGQITIEEFADNKTTVELQREIMQKGLAKVKMTYSVMETEVERETKTYRFLSHYNLFEKIEVLAKGVEENKIE